MTPARTRLREAAVRHATWTRRTAAASRALGVRTLAERLERIAGELLTIAVPSSLVGDAGAAVRMRQWSGADQVVNALRDGGWTGFEHPVPSVLAAAVAARGGVVLDVGANTGFYALVAAVAHPDARVVAFEPHPPVAALLRSNLVHNPALRGRVEVREVGIGSEVGSAPLYVPPGDHGLVETSASLDPRFKLDIDHDITVTVATIDSLAIDGVTVIKIDVEGVEGAVLHGAARTLQQQRPLVFYELLPGGDAAAVEEVRRAAGYVDIRLRAGGALAGSAPQFDPDAWNHLLAPDEAMEETVTLLARAGVPLLRSAGGG